MYHIVSAEVGSDSSSYDGVLKDVHTLGSVWDDHNSEEWDPVCYPFRGWQGVSGQEKIGMFMTAMDDLCIYEAYCQIFQ